MNECTRNSQHKNKSPYQSKELRNYEEFIEPKEIKRFNDVNQSKGLANWRKLKAHLEYFYDRQNFRAL